MRWIRFAGLLVVLAFASMLFVGDLDAQQTLFATAPGSPISVGAGPGNVALGDVNMDGHLDLLVAIDQEPGITILPGQGDGEFHAAQGKHLALPNPPGDIAVADFNGDSLPDLAISSHDSYGVMLALGDGKAGFKLAPNSPVIMTAGEHSHTHGLGTGDVNGDGHLDLITANYEDSSIAVALNNGQGEFISASGSPFAVEQSPYPFALGDVNSDGHLDIIATSTAPSSSRLTILLGDGQAGFQRRTVELRTVQPWFPAIGDVNGDAKPDVVTTHWERNELTVALGDGNGNFTEINASPFDLGQSAFQIGIVQGTGATNALVLAAAGDGMRVMVGDGEGGFEAAPGSPFPTENGSWRFALGDVNGDGKLDIATSNFESDSVSILLAQ